MKLEILSYLNRELMAHISPGGNTWFLRFISSKSDSSVYFGQTLKSLHISTL